MEAQEGKDICMLTADLGLSCGSAVKNLPGSQWTACNVGNTRSIPEWGRSAGEGNSKSLQYSRLVG